MQAIETYLNRQEKSFRFTGNSSFKRRSKFYPILSQELPKEKESGADDVQSQAQQCLSLIEDPLWKHVCSQIIDIIGPVWVLKIYDSQLGPLSPQDKNVNLYCQTEKTAQFLEQCECIILGSLQQYFPLLKEIKIRKIVSCLQRCVTLKER